MPLRQAFLKASAGRLAGDVRLAFFHMAAALVALTRMPSRFPG